MGYGRDGLWADDGVLVAGFEAFELFESGVEGAAGGVDPVLLGVAYGRGGVSLRRDKAAC